MADTPAATATATAAPAAATPAPAAAPAVQPAPANPPRREPPPPQTVRIEVVQVPGSAPAPQPVLPPVPPPRPASASASSSDNGGWIAFVAVFVGIALLILLVYALFGPPSKQQDAGVASPRTPAVTSTAPPPAAAPGDAGLPAGVYRDKNGQLRVQRAAPDNSPSGEWRESRISCRGRAKGTQFRCGEGGVDGWCTC